MTQGVGFPQAIEGLQSDYKLQGVVPYPSIDPTKRRVDSFRLVFPYINLSFLTTVNMSSAALSPLAQSADKQLLFSRLGLTEQVHKLLLVSRYIDPQNSALTQWPYSGRGSGCERQAE